MYLCGGAFIVDLVCMIIVLQTDLGWLAYAL